MVNYQELIEPGESKVITVRTIINRIKTAHMIDFLTTLYYHLDSNLMVEVTTFQNDNETFCNPPLVRTDV